MTVSSGEQQTYKRANVVTCARAETLLLAPLVGGVVDLRRIVALTGRARASWDGFEGVVTVVDVQQGLRREEGVADSRASADAVAFLRELVAAGLLEVANGEPPSAAPAQPRAPSTDDRAVELGAADIEAFAAAVLGQGHVLRMVAHGGSMRPWLPDGSVLEVVPRSFESARWGDIVLYSAGTHRLVAHRVVGRRSGFLVTRGDSARRRDLVDAEHYLGVVACRLHGTARTPLTTRGHRVLGLLSGAVHGVASLVVRACVVLPLRHVRAVRIGCRWGLSVISEVLRRGERLAARLRRRLDVGRAGLMTTNEKDTSRQELYAGKGVQDFTALEENVDAGLTLIEEVLLARHALAPGRLLVLGCGPGRECLALARQGHRVTGVDREEGMLARARARAADAGLEIRFVAGEVTDFDLPDEHFDAVVVFSGLYNMVLPRARRVELLRAAARHLEAGGLVLLTFLSDYVRPGARLPAGEAAWLRAVNADHEHGDLYLLNEAVHIFPSPEAVQDEARQAGFDVRELFRDQRAYDKATRQVRGYLVLEKRD